MAKPIPTLRNLGPKMEAMLAEVDVPDDAALRDIGAIEAYRRLKFRFGRRITLTALYAMEAALRDCHWRALDSETKAKLRQGIDRSID